MGRGGGVEEMNVRKAAHSALCYKRTKRHRHAAAAAAGHGDRHHVITLVLMKSCRIDIVLQKSNSLISVSGATDCGASLSYMHSASHSAISRAQKHRAGCRVKNTSMIHKIKNLQF